MMRTRTKEQRSIEENNRRQEYTEEKQYKEKKVSKTCCTSDNWSVEFYLYPTVSTALVHSVKPKLTE